MFIENKATDCKLQTQALLADFLFNYLVKHIFKVIQNTGDLPALEYFLISLMASSKNRTKIASKIRK